MDPARRGIETQMTATRTSRRTARRPVRGRKTTARHATKRAAAKPPAKPLSKAAARLLPRDAEEIRPLRVALREHHMLPIARAGRRLMEFAPGARRAYRVPKKRASMEALLAGAERLAAYVQKHARPFLRSGFEQDFIGKLRAATAVLRERTGNTGEGRRRRATARRRRI
jgi:hypothetical protein